MGFAATMCAVDVVSESAGGEHFANPDLHVY